jgi:hypothetical protein
LLLVGLVNSSFGVDRTEISQRSKSFKKYLNELSWKTSAPWPMILASAKVMGLSQTEIDAIPASFPFLYGEKYERVFGLLETPFIIDLINLLIEQFEEQSGLLPSAKRRELLHQLIHTLILKELGLAATTTTKQLAHYVSKGTLSMNRLYEVQLAAFFVKYYLDI